MKRALAYLSASFLALAPLTAWAQDDEAEEEVEEEDPEVVISDLKLKLQDLEARLDNMEQSQLNKPPGVKIFGYADLGFFAPFGNGGSGVQRDVGYEAFPEHSNFGWVFYGDLLATQVNSRGEAADLGDLPNAPRFDSVNSNGNPSFLVNELNLSLNAALSARALFSASVNFMPRSGREFSLGDFIDVDTVQVEWIPTDDAKHSIFVGKFDSVLGHEYKTRKASQRFGITPSLVHRYTAGTAIGLKVRSKLFDDHLILALSLTNGSYGTEQFHFHQELDTNAFKTVSGRLATRVKLGGATLELGGSGQVGEQDGAPDGAGMMWFGGADLELSTVRMSVKAQWLVGSAPGDEVSRTYKLDLKGGGYLELNWLLTAKLGILLRGEYRDALVSLGDERLYLTKSWRAVAGARFVVGEHLILKGEYLHNGEYGGVPSFGNDVLTTSLVVLY
jgi:hypothetical protein